jgi:lysophospholipase L1-like esterase
LFLERAVTIFAVRLRRLTAATIGAAALVAALAALNAAGSASAIVPVRVAAPIVGPPSSIAALGDSFNTGFDAGPSRGDAPSLSWSTGDDSQVDSLYLRLLAMNPAARNHRYLIAKDGTKVGDLARQMSLAADHHAQLITIQSGGNDICSAKDPDHATTPAVFREEFQGAIDVMRQRLPNARLLLTSITDEGRWNDGSAQIPGNGKKLSDGTVCDPKLDRDGKQDPTRRAEIQTLEKRDDAILRQVCATDAHCLWDDGAFYRLAYTAVDVSKLDAFHPSIEGLNRFASTAWNVGFAYADRTAPTVSATVQSISGSVQLSLKAHAGAGIAGIEYRLAPGPYSAYTKALVVPAGGTVVYRSVDRNGNVSAAWSLTAPEATS